MKTKNIHFNVSMISRGKGQSTVAAAYRSGQDLFCYYDGLWKDFTRKDHVIYSDILLPKNAPVEFLDRKELWNFVEYFENRSNSQLARQVEFSLPVEQDSEERKKLAIRMGNYFRNEGMVVDLNIHDPGDGHNPHCHLLLTLRPFDENGNFISKKYERVYRIDENGNKIPKILKSVKVDYEFDKMAINNWNDKDRVEVWRSIYSDYVNEAFRDNKIKILSEHKSFKRQGSLFLPTIHEGPAVTALEKKGIKTRVGEINREIKAFNETLKKSLKAKKQLEKDLEQVKSEIERLKDFTSLSHPSEYNLRWADDWKTFMTINYNTPTRKSKTQLLKTTSSQIALLEDYKINSIKDLEDKIKDLNSTCSDLVKEERNVLDRMKALGDFLDFYKGQYLPNKELYIKYKSLPKNKKEDFLNSNPDAYTIKARIDYFKKALNTDKFNYSSIKNEYEKLSDNLYEIKGKYSKAASDYDNLYNILKKIKQVQIGLAREGGICSGGLAASLAGLRRMRATGTPASETVHFVLSFSLGVQIPSCNKNAHSFV